MMIKYTYLAIDFFTIIIPFIFSFDRKSRFYRKWKFYFPGMIFTAVFFIIWDYFKTKYGVWGFNGKYITGLKFFGLPIEEILFFFTVPYACTFIYETVSRYLKDKLSAGHTKYFVWLYGLAAFTLSFFVLDKAYTFSVLFMSGLVLPLSTLALKGNKLNIFLITYLISLLPMAVVNGLLTYLPVVTYNNSQNLNLRIGTMPVEDLVYCIILLAMNIGLYEWQMERHQKV